MIQRQITPSLLKDLKQKMIILSGPRQVGKTTLSKGLLSKYEYLSYDIKEDRRLILDESFSKDTSLLVFDEIHKMKKWKTYLKGLYDQKMKPQILVTGSARLDLFKKGGDSLAGRHFFYKLNPFSHQELKATLPTNEIIQRMLQHGGFPDPFLNNQIDYSKKWRKSHVERVIREDIYGLEKKGDIRSLEILVELLQDRIGSTVSYQSLAEDLHVSIHTVKSWLLILEQLFVIFKVPPYSKNIARSLQKESKYYFYDVGQNIDDISKRLENYIACELKFYLDYLESTQGDKAELYFVRDKNKREVDFLTLINKKPHSLIEVKVADANFSKSLLHFSEQIAAKSYQITLEKNRKKQVGEALLVSLEEYLEQHLY